MLRRANSEEEARRIFAQSESALDTEKETPAGADVPALRTIRMVGEEYLHDSRERGKRPRTMEGRESRLNAHILPPIGEVPVAKWRVEHSHEVMEKGAKTIHSARGREDLRGQLAAMRKLTWRLGWLDRSIDPLDGLEIGRSNVLHGATAQYVDPRLRPETRQVKAMAAAADKLCGPDGTDPLMTHLPLFGTKIRVAGFGGLRLGEPCSSRRHPTPTRHRADQGDPVAEDLGHDRLAVLWSELEVVAGQVQDVAAIAEALLDSLLQFDPTVPRRGGDHGEVDVAV